MNRPIVFFDGVCNLCNAFINWLMRQDSRGVFQVASLQGQTAEAKLPHQSRVKMNTIILLTPDGKILQKSDAILWIWQKLSFPWGLLSVCQWIPRPIRDWIYDLVAANRYRLFGRRDSCRLPSPEEKSRFLD